MAPKAKTKAMQKRAPAFGATQPKRLKLTPAQARLKELYDKAWQNADGKGKQILTEVAALGYYPINRPLGPTVERFLSLRLERIVGDASPHLSSHLDALSAVPHPVRKLPYEYSYDGKQLNRTTDEMFIAEVLIQDLKSFVAQHKRMPRESEVRVKSIGRKKEEAASNAGGDDKEGDGIGDPDDKPDGDINPAIGIGIICERRLAQRLHRRMKTPGFFTGDQLNEIIRIDPACHPEVEAAWDTLASRHWCVWEEITSQRSFEEAYRQNKLSKEAFELLRDVDSVRGHIDQKRLESFGRSSGSQEPLAFEGHHPSLARR